MRIAAGAEALCYMCGADARAAAGRSNRWLALLCVHRRGRLAAGRARARTLAQHRNCHPCLRSGTQVQQRDLYPAVTGYVANRLTLISISTLVRLKKRVIVIARRGCSANCCAAHQHCGTRKHRLYAFGPSYTTLPHSEIATSLICRPQISLQPLLAMTTLFC